jgi:hypothetical protein
MPSPLPRLRKICLSFPEAHEVEAWGEPTFRVKGKMFAMYAADGNHHGSGRASVWIKSDKENQALMLRAQPDRYFKPPYVGPSGWVGVYLDRSPDWDEVRELLRDGWKSIAPKKLLSSTPETRSRVQSPKPKAASRSKAPSPKRGRG